MIAIDEGRAIPGHSLRVAQVRQRRDQAIAHFVIGVEGQNPFALKLGNAEIALIGEAVERPREQHNLGIAREDIERPIRATAAHNDDAPCPCDLVELRARRDGFDQSGSFHEQ
jgi:hypothetical protein